MKKNPVEESLKQLDLKGLLFLNMLITERALTIIHEKETVMDQFKPPVQTLLMPNNQIIK